MAREGLGVVIGLVLGSMIIVVGAFLNPFLHLKILAAILVLITILSINFFRDPERQVPEGVDNIIAPADGKVIEIIDERERDYLKTDATRISIFMNIFDVHVNRIPMTGKVEYFRYQRGSFIKAYKSEAADINEQTVIGIENDGRKVLFKQIAGLIARRIVCYIREGSNVRRGERFGIIKFGSRVDVFVPKSVAVKVKTNERVKAGESILGVFT